MAASSSVRVTEVVGAWISIVTLGRLVGASKLWITYERSADAGSSTTDLSVLADSESILNDALSSGACVNCIAGDVRCHTSCLSVLVDALVHLARVCGRRAGKRSVSALGDRVSVDVEPVSASVVDSARISVITVDSTAGASSWSGGRVGRNAVVDDANRRRSRASWLVRAALASRKRVIHTNTANSTSDEVSTNAVESRRLLTLSSDWVAHASHTSGLIVGISITARERCVNTLSSNSVTTSSYARVRS